jgi:hypothetical protein
MANPTNAVAYQNPSESKSFTWFLSAGTERNIITLVSSVVGAYLGGILPACALGGFSSKIISDSQADRASSVRDENNALLWQRQIQAGNETIAAQREVQNTQRAIAITQEAQRSLYTTEERAKAKEIEVNEINIEAKKAEMEWNEKIRKAELEVIEKNKKAKDAEIQNAEQSARVLSIAKAAILASVALLTTFVSFSITTEDNSFAARNCRISSGVFSFVAIANVFHKVFS